MEDGDKLAAFSMICWRRIATGEAERITGYDTHYVRGAWAAKESAFIAPEAGLYFLSLSYVRDQQSLPHKSNGYTNEDTRIDIMVNNEKKSHAAAPGGGPRQVGTVSLILHLDKGDELWTKDWAQEEDKERRLEDIVFSGHRIGNSDVIK